ncbi:MAG: DUF4097 domain-containing protein [Prevotellaceae bacterium]|jgi:hypothetical protein|nr:DUF4097 domain-containing protein [Prevotellaceae bacterium]
MEVMAVNDSIKKLLKIILSVLATIIALGFITILLANVTGYDLMQDENGRYKFMKNANILSDTMDLQTGIQALSFELISEDIKIVTTEANTFRLEYSWLEWDEKPSISVSGGKLVYKTREKLRHVVSNFFHNAAKPPITLYVPKGTSFENANVRTASGNIEINNIESEALSAYSTSGAITAKKSPVKTVTIETSTGGVTLNELKGVNFTLRTSSAIVRVEDVSFETYDVTSNSGECSFTNASGGNLKVQSTTGSLSINGSQLEGFDFITSSGSANITDLVTDEILVKSDSGNITTKRLDVAKGSFTMLSGNVDLDLTGSEDEYSFIINSPLNNVYLNNKNIDGSQTYSGGQTYSPNVNVPTGNVYQHTSSPMPNPMPNVTAILPTNVTVGSGEKTLTFDLTGGGYVKITTN